MPLGYFTDSTPLTPLRDPFNVLVDGINAVETAIEDLEDRRAIQTFRWADASERSAQTGMVAGDVGYQIDTNTLYYYTGSAWYPTVGPYCLLNKSSNQSLTTTPTPLTWDVEVADPFEMHNNTSNTSRIIAPVAGVYEVVVSLYNNNTSGMGTVSARKNGAAEVPGSFTRRDGTANAGCPLAISFFVNLAANDYIEIMVQHSTSAGAIIGSTTSNSGATVGMKRVSF